MELKMVFTDMEGTVLWPMVKRTHGISPSIWTYISKLLGDRAYEEEEASKIKWRQGGYANYLEWMIDTIEMYIRHGLTREIFEKAIDTTELYPGAIQLFQALHSKNIITALITGGLKAQADIVQQELKIHHAMSACEFFWNGDGSLVHYNLLPTDLEGKLDFMKLMIKEYGLKEEQCAFIGDGINDVKLAEAVGLSIAFNAEEELRQVSTHVINQGEPDMKEIISILLP